MAGSCVSVEHCCPSFSEWKEALMDRCVSLIRTSLGSQLLTADTADIVTSPFMLPL